MKLTDFGITGNPSGFPMSRLKNLKKLKLMFNMEKITDESIKLIENMGSLKEVKLRVLDPSIALANPIYF